MIASVKELASLDRDLSNHTNSTLSKADLKRIRKVQLKMDRLATDLLAGIYRSAFKGRGMEFEEVREFQPGDEVRSVDWNVTARMGTPYVKTFREERELTIFLLVDISFSNRFSSRNELKRAILSEISAAIAFSSIKNRDKIGLILFSGEIELYLAPAKGTRHVLRLIRDLLVFPPKNHGTNFAKALNFLGEVQKKKCVVFFLSDFIGGGDYQNALRTISKKHDLIAIAVSDPLEQTMPNVGLVNFKDLETGAVATVDTSAPKLKEILSREYQERLTRSKKSIEKSGGVWLQVTTDQPYIPVLRKFFLMRKKRRL